MPGNSLAQRVVTAVVVLAFLLPAFLLLPKVFGEALVGLFVLGAAWEWSAFLGSPARGARLAYVAMIAVLVFIAALVVPRFLPVSTVILASLAWWAVAVVCIARFPIRITAAMAAAGGILVLLPTWVSMTALLETPVGGRTLVLLALAIVWAADVGAFFAGRSFGRVKLAVRVSPGKTWEGVIGGLTCAALTAAAGAVWLGHPAGPAVALGLSVAAISIVGDLTVSMFKRSAGLKDSGNLFPGHGGVLDRVDSVTAAAPLFVLLAARLGWLG
jgi:phosphatidate cytidylyltransferase